jgi:hypothetical protein
MPDFGALKLFFKNIHSQPCNLRRIGRAHFLSNNTKKKIQNNEIRRRKFRGGPVGTRHRTSDSKVALEYFSLSGSCIDRDFSCPSNAGLQKERTLLWVSGPRPSCYWAYTTSWLSS